ncbi:hypothetical protein Y1Q_0004111 [Alligator mississippiensis]|uniref:Uncharacterized protein n=1 Tax=Alligator mississippiensis TaxID=8496 RepID=A0A151PI58_ALLMI|nr:hypothetical protein Y1Q_0004111 [Alligator mississippiensis]
MADEYDHLTVAYLRELMKERGLLVRKEQKSEHLIKILCDNDEAARSPLRVLPEPTGGTECPPSEWHFQKFQLQLEAEEREHKLKRELELKRLELEVQHQREKEQREHEAREAHCQREHELAVLRMQTNAETVGTQPALAASPRLDTPVFSCYKDGEDPKVFLSNFESQACQWKLPKEELMKHMAALVEGDMSVVLNSLPLESADNYNTFREAVHVRFKLGAD